MGIYRLLFAVAVLVWHCPPGILGRFLHPAIAVQCFYAVSGFLIQMVILEKYCVPDAGKWKLAFYKSRLLRILPLYFLFLLLTIYFLGDWRDLPNMLDKGHYFPAFITIANNLLVVGQDIMRFFHYVPETGKMIFVSQEVLNPVPTPGINLTILPQSWTLALELYFYLLAPFLLTRGTRPILTVVAASIFIRFLVGMLGDFNNSWFYGFFPSEIGIFFCGALAYRAYRRWLAEDRLGARRRQWNLLAFATVAVMTYWYFTVDFNFTRSSPFPFFIRYMQWHYPPIGAPFGYWAVLMATIATLPFAYRWSRWQKSWDKWVGELSYPIYISHFFILLMIQRHTAIPENYIGLVTLIITLLVSIALVIAVDRPLSHLRHRFFYKNALRLDSDKQTPLTGAIA